MMKITQSVFLFCLIAILAGCTSDQQRVTRLRPPEAFNPTFLRYKELPGQKIMVIAVDPTGEWAYGYDAGKSTLEEAAINATVKCDRAREKFKVFAPARLFAVNDEIVYYDGVLGTK